MQALGYGGTTLVGLITAMSWINAQVVTAGDLTPIKQEIVEIRQQIQINVNALEAKIDRVATLSALRSRQSNLALAIQKYESDLFTLKNIKSEDRRTDYAGRLEKVDRELGKAEDQLKDVETAMRQAGLRVG